MFLKETFGWSGLICLSYLTGIAGFDTFYRFKLDIGNPNIYCPEPNYTCRKGELHYLCENANSGSRCANYLPISVTKQFKKSFVQGTNGIRNKLASDFGIANMNLVYWSDELSKMAERFLKTCKHYRDPCLIIGQKHIRVSQNFRFFRKPPTRSIAALVIRSWFLELQVDKNRVVRNFRDYKKEHRAGALGNLTNLIYPLNEFVGCAGTRMDYGTYLMTCYYHPPYNRSEFPKNFIKGDPATQCSTDRKPRSKTFQSLCGVDMEISEKSVFVPNIILLLFLHSFIFIVQSTFS